MAAAMTMKNGTIEPRPPPPWPAAGAPRRFHPQTTSPGQTTPSGAIRSEIQVNFPPGHSLAGSG